MAHITFLAYPKCSMAGIAGPIDTFSIANLWHHGGRTTPLFTWDIVTMDGNPVQGRGGLEIPPNCSIHDIDKTDIILIPGFLPPLEFIGNVPDKLKEWLRRRYENNTMLGTVCTGTFFLAETGLLDGKTATTNWMFARQFRENYPNVRLKTEHILTEDKGIICTGATTSFFNLCFYLIRKFGSEDLSIHCEKSMLLDPCRVSQSPYMMLNFKKNHTDEKVLAAQTYMEENFNETISVEALASDLGFSPRHFKRRFKTATGDTPLGYLQEIRIEAAKKKLETTQDTINEITWHVGYEDCNSFRRLFKKSTGLSPKEYRDRFTRMNNVCLQMG